MILELALTLALTTVGIEERLGAEVPLEVELTSSEGRPVKLGDLFRDGRPVVLVLAYERCPALCGLVLGSAARSLGGLDWRLGREYRAVTVSIDPEETPRRARARQRETLVRAGAPDRERDWPFLVGREAAVRAIASAVGFRYRLDAATNEYDHPAVLVVLTPEGRVSRYLYGVEYRARDLKAALFEASRGEVGGTLERLLLRCFRYDPARRRYGVAVATFVRAGSLAVAAGVAVFLATLWRRDRMGS